MASVTLDGPVVRRGAHNVVLRDALLHSPVDRSTVGVDRTVVEVGIREGDFTTWIGSWDESKRDLKAGVPESILDSDRLNMRLRERQAIVTRVTSYGNPSRIRGSRVNFRLGRVGGRDGELRPLVAGGPVVQDQNTRSAISTIQRQINQGLSEWEESVQLIDPVVVAPKNTFEGRLQVDSTTELSIQQYTGNWIEVDGDAVPISDDGISVTTSDALLESTGSVGSSTPVQRTLYYVYVGLVGGRASLRLSGTAPERYTGSYYLGSDFSAKRWRFVGWVYTDNGNVFADTPAQRLCANYYNRVVKDLFRNPGYADDNAETTITTTSATWTRAATAKAGRVEFISNAEDAVVIHGTCSVSNSGANWSLLGVNLDSTTDCLRAGIHEGTLIGNIAVHYSDVVAVGFRYSELMVRVSAGTGTYITDDARAGAVADPPVTYISGQVLV